MHAHFLDNYSHADSPIHRLPAGLKIVAALAALVAIVTVPVAHLAFFAALAFALLLAAAASLVPGAFLLKRMIFLEPMVLGVAVLSLLSPGGLHTFAAIVLRGTLCITTTVLLANTTPLSEILRVLRRFHVPPLLVTTLALMHRYLFVLLEESRRMRRARACRTFTPDRRRAWATLASVVGQLFLRSVDRAERVYAAMCARGWQ
jgi:cobalt/nickel transport system permease protein